MPRAVAAAPAREAACGCACEEATGRKPAQPLQPPANRSRTIADDRIRPLHGSYPSVWFCQQICSPQKNPPSLLTAGSYKNYNDYFSITRCKAVWVSPERTMTVYIPAANVRVSMLTVLSTGVVSYTILPSVLMM